MALLSLGSGLQSVILLTVGIALAVAGLSVLFVGIYAVFATNVIIGDTLGLPIGFRRIPGPPRSAGRYEAWCKQRRVTPYAADTPAQS
jgi:hypothetical protein